jgi:hypothetical protein
MPRPAGPLTWNLWVERNSRRGVLGEPLKADTTYKLRIALAFAQLLDEIAAGAVSQELITGIAEAREKDESGLDVDIYAFSSDPTVLQLLDRRFDLKISFDKLDAAKKAKLPERATVLKDLTAGTSPDYIGAEASVAFRISKGSSGEESITIVAVARGTGITLDVRTIDLCIEKRCDAMPLQGGGTDFRLGGALPKQDLSLLLFDTKKATPDSKTKAHALVIYGDRDKKTEGALAWRTDVGIAELAELAEPIKDFVGSAEQDVKVLRRNGRSLAERVFTASPERPADAENVKKALGVFSAFAARADTGAPASLWIRLATRGSDPHPVIPFGLFSMEKADAKGEYFWGKSFALAAALPGQAFTASQCPAGWIALLPPESNTDNALRLVRSNLQKTMAAWKGHADIFAEADGMSKFRDWVRGMPDKVDGGRVLAMVGHYDGKRFYFGPTESLTGNDFARSFRAPSVALLNACDSSGKSVSDGSILGQLAQRNVQSAVVTTSRVPAKLAAAYFECLHATLAAESPMTMGVAHHKTLKCLAGEHEFVALKYLLYGNPSQPICVARR